MAVDWLGFGFAAVIAVGGFMGYKRKGNACKQSFKQDVKISINNNMFIFPRVFKPNLLLITEFICFNLN